MTRRNLFATLLAPLVAKFAGPKQRPGESRLHFLYRTGTMKYVPFGEWANPIASPTDEDYASGRVKQLGDTINIRLPAYYVGRRGSL